MGTSNNSLAIPRQTDMQYATHTVVEDNSIAVALPPSREGEKYHIYEERIALK